MKSKRKFAAALRHDAKGDRAPVVTAKGHGTVAEKIEQIANESDTPIVVDEALAELMTHLHVETPIPSELYEVVAEVFAFVYKIDREMKEIHEVGNVSDKGGSTHGK
ncbi:hypothetical protein DH09_04645 [Bacillaceae bacterium JMAK1]|nr:hypothetical protein DH09_04645 [Bacillaceae bacterium JMAK1]